MVGEDRSRAEIKVHRTGEKIQRGVYESSPIVQVVQVEYKVSTVCDLLRCLSVLVVWWIANLGLDEKRRSNDDRRKIEINLTAKCQVNIVTVPLFSRQPGPGGSKRRSVQKPSKEHTRRLTRIHPEFRSDQCGKNWFASN